jgi:hypothetical protein
MWLPQMESLLLRSTLAWLIEAENQRGAYPHRLWEHEKSKYKRYAILMQGGSGKVVLDSVLS